MAVKALKTRSCSRSTIIFIAIEPKKVIDGNPLIVHNLSLQRMAWAIKHDKDATTRNENLIEPRGIVGVGRWGGELAPVN